MPLQEINHRYTGRVIYSCKAETFKACAERAVKGKVNLRGADMRWADMREANMIGANMRGADMSWADMRGADMREANMIGADMRWADMREANMIEADMRGADMDFSCWPLSCKSTSVVADDRLFAQLFFHLTRLDVSQCSGGARESMDALRSMAASDLFCEYRSDVGKPVNEQ